MPGHSDVTGFAFYTPALACEWRDLMLYSLPIESLVLFINGLGVHPATLGGAPT